VRRSFAESDDTLQSFIPGAVQDRIISIPSVEIRGPFTVAGMSETPSREQLYTCQPKEKADETACGREILARVATRAYRRALTTDDMQPLMQFFEAGRNDGGFDEGIRRALTRILASPNFLYRAELAPANAHPGDVYQLSSIDLASRLSFFLWSSIPDDQLLQDAAEDKLQDPAMLQAEVKRMLADPKAKSLSENFGYQWLKLSKLDELNPDPEIFPYASGAGDLRPDFKQELNLFVDSVFRSDQSLMRLLDADYTFVNERLALHYGIKDVKGDRFRRVPLTDSNRFGLLGKGGVLMVTAYPNRTSPVLRGAWILETIMGAPPPQPPANVPALKENEKGKVATTVRERLEQHRKNPVCFSCHSVMDPLGFALDNFDAVGRWREIDRQSGSTIDSSGLMPNGKTVKGAIDLRNALMTRPNNFVQGIADKLMIYALGRTLDARDMPVVRKVVRDTAAQDYRFEAMVTSIITSPLFEKNTVPVAKIADATGADRPSSKVAVQAPAK